MGKVEAKTEMATIPNTAEAAELEEVVLLPPLLAMAALLYMVQEAEAEAVERIPLVDEAEIGPHTTLEVLVALGERLEVLVVEAQQMEQPEQVVSLEPVVAAAAEGGIQQVAVTQAMGEPEVRQVAVVAVAEPEAARMTAEQEPEEKCEYGPGSSEHRRTQRPGCAEA